MVALIGLLVGFGAGPLREALGRERLAAAAAELGRRMQRARWHAVAGRRSVGLRFEAQGEGFQVSTYRDGDGDGIRSDDILAGLDPLLEPSFRPQDRRGAVRFGIPPGSYPRVPPASGTIDGDDPIRFGRSSIASFSPLGSATPGTAYLTDADQRLAAVVVYGATARIRVRIFDRGSFTWR